MVVDSHDNLWAAQADNGPSRILHISERGSPPVIERAAKSDLTSPQTHALFEDRESNIWIGTERGLISLGGFPIGRKVAISSSWEPTQSMVRMTPPRITGPFGVA